MDARCDHAGKIVAVARKAIETTGRRWRKEMSCSAYIDVVPGFAGTTPWRGVRAPMKG
jgi:hypothetical protein